MIWATILRPGYFGKHRDRLAAAWNAEYGIGNWRIAWQWNDAIIDRALALQLYEDGYAEHMRRTPSDLGWLVRTACDVYDTAPSNVEASLSYDCQETPNNHLHDVAIRRAVLRNGALFRGDHLVHVRDENSEGYRFNPGIVPFHLERLIITGPLTNSSGKEVWWRESSIEDFYQRNKILQVKEYEKDKRVANSVNLS